MMTTAGSLALVGATPPKDAFIVTRLREAGAVILGKTNLSEWANFRSTHSTSGWSGRGGQTKNPYALDRNPSGSSSGSGAAIAANLARGGGRHRDRRLDRVAVEQQWPRRDQADARPAQPQRHRADLAQPGHRRPDDPHRRRRGGAARRDGRRRLGRSAADAGRTTGRFATTRGSSIPTASKGARIGVVRNKYFGSSPATDALAEAAIAVMKQQGATIVDPANIPTLGKFDDGEFQVLLYEFKADLNKYLTWLGAASPVHSLKDVIAFNDAHKDQEMPYFGQEIMTMAEKKGPLTSAKYVSTLARNRQMARALGIDATLTKYKLDALFAPTSGPAGLIDLVNGDSGGGCVAVDRHVGRRLPAHHGARRVLPRSAGGDVVLRPRLERADADQAGLRLRAGDEAPQAADVRGDRRSVTTLNAETAEPAEPCSVCGFSAFCVDRRRHSVLCQSARPTKNGPSRSRYSDVCCVFRIVCTSAESG